MPPIAGLALTLALGLVLLAVLGLVLKWLWNTTLPEIAGASRISTVQAVKLIFLSAILFGGHRIVTVQPVVRETPTQPVAVDAPRPVAVEAR